MGYMPSPIELLFLGTGTSAGIPMIGCHCAVCTSPDPHDMRMRPSVVISYNDENGQSHRVLVDTTPELRLQCIAHKIDSVDAVVFTHAHADHIMGLDDVRRFNALKRAPLDVWADDATFAALKRCFGYAFVEPPVEMKVFRPHLIHRAIDGPFTVAGQRWEPIPLIHGATHVLGFRIGTLAYCTDVSAIPEGSWPLLENLDILVLDALQPTAHATHFSLQQAIEAASRIKARQTYFTHIAHGMAYESTNRSLPAHMQLAHDGQVIRTHPC